MKKRDIHEEITSDFIERKLATARAELKCIMSRTTNRASKIDPVQSKWMGGLSFDASLAGVYRVRESYWGVDWINPIEDVERTWYEGFDLDAAIRAYNKRSLDIDNGIDL